MRQERDTSCRMRRRDCQLPLQQKALRTTALLCMVTSCSSAMHYRENTPPPKQGDLCLRAGTSASTRTVCPGP